MIELRKTQPSVYEVGYIAGCGLKPDENVIRFGDNFWEDFGMRRQGTPQFLLLLGRKI